jgi:hypothetical protein
MPVHNVLTSSPSFSSVFHNHTPRHGATTRPRVTCSRTPTAQRWPVTKKKQRVTWPPLACSGVNPNRNGATNLELLVQRRSEATSARCGARAAPRRLPPPQPAVAAPPASTAARCRCAGCATWRAAMRGNAHELVQTRARRSSGIEN